MKARTALAIAFVSIAPTVATAESQEDQMACMNDAFNVCGHAIPDRGRVAACLAQNINRISSACRAVIRRHPRPAATPREAASTIRASTVHD